MDWNILKVSKKEEHKTGEKIETKLKKRKLLKVYQNCLKYKLNNPRKVRFSNKS